MSGVVSLDTISAAGKRRIICDRMEIGTMLEL